MLSIPVTQDALSRICPMHLHVSCDGRIDSAGPTLQKLHPDKALVGAWIFDVFQIERPRVARRVEDLLNHAPAAIRVNFRKNPEISLKGNVCPTEDDGGALINLGFGLSILDAVNTFPLTNKDFSPTDLAMELLFVVEAKSAAMDSTRTLNHQLKIAMDALEEQALTDTLTGLRNRRAMESHVDDMLASERKFALTQIDLDYFKQINDTLGHGAGDYVLQHVSRIMQEVTRPNDICVRTGGDEFVIVFDGFTSQRDLHVIAGRLISEIEQPIMYENDLCHISASAGTVIADIPETRGLAGLLRDSDLALYSAKRNGRACHRFYTPDLVT